jgi:hypothetical protein
VTGVRSSATSATASCLTERACLRHRWAPQPQLSLTDVTRFFLLLQICVTRREKFCDFCNCELPDWKSVLTPSLGNTAPAVMNVNFDNKTYSFHVAPGGWIMRVMIETAVGHMLMNHI